MKTDIEIAQEAKMRPITEIAAPAGAPMSSGPLIALQGKIDHRLIHDAKNRAS